MPYIDQAARIQLDTREPVTSGELNYVITRLVDAYVRRTGVRYTSINEAVGALECAKLELYRRIAAPYEEAKLTQNGDVYRSRADLPYFAP